MRIRFLSAAGSADTSYSSGAEYEVSDELATAMLNAGLAEPVEQRDEVSTDDRGERAVKRSPRRKTKSSTSK